MFRNDRNFYHRKSDKSSKGLITIYSPDKPYVVYDKEEWWKDDWNPLDYGQEFDFNRTFSEQFQELRLKVPRANLFTSNEENSYYTNHALNVKNCYLIWGGGNDEDCLYGNFIAECTDMVDGLSIYSSEKCYQGIASERCYNCIEFINCRDCTDCIMVEDCTSCTNCIGCFGLYRKEYCLFNQEVGKEEWEKRRAELGCINTENTALLRQNINALKQNLPHRYAHIYSSENCTGDNIYNSKGCHYCFDINNCEDCKYTAFTPNAKNTHDCIFTAPEGLETSYNACSSLGGQMMLFTFLAYYCNDTYYSMECHNCKNLFGCASMRSNEHCILNKQYEKEEYENMVSRIINHMQETGEWGEFLDTSTAPVCYNESNAYDFFPLTKEEVLQRGWTWRDEDAVTEEGQVLRQVPYTIAEVEDSITQRVLICEQSKKQYKITPQELKFYRDMNIALPRKNAVARHKDRLDLRNPRRLWHRNCTKCQKSIATNYSPERSEIVYCEECYLAEVY